MVAAIDASANPTMLATETGIPDKRASILNITGTIRETCWPAQTLLLESTLATVATGSSHSIPTYPAGTRHPACVVMLPCCGCQISESIEPARIFVREALMDSMHEGMDRYLD